MWPAGQPAPASAQAKAAPPQNGTSEGTPALAVAELLAGYLMHAREYHRHPDGSPTTEYHDITLSLRAVVHMYGALPAAEFSP